MLPWGGIRVDVARNAGEQDRKPQTCGQYASPGMEAGGSQILVGEVNSLERLVQSGPANY
jgi:hypothetical protein